MHQSPDATNFGFVVSDQVTSETPPPTPPPTERTGNDWARTALWIGVVLILAGAGVYVFKSCRDLPGEMAVKSGNAIRDMGKALADVASAFRRGTISTSFVSYATSVTNQQYLQFATLKQMELFTHTDAPTTGFGYIPLPEVVVEARAPVEYTYYLDLKGEWKFVLQDHVVHVLAPPIRFNKPAVDVSKLNYEVRKGYLKSSEATERLKSSITSLVTLKAKENIPLVKETARKETAEFVESWLVKSFTDGKVYAVKVYFPDETQQFSLIQTNEVSRIPTP